MYPLYQSIVFWISVSFFIYFTGNFFFFIFTNATNDVDFINQLQLIYGIVTITKNILLCLSLFANEPVEKTNEILDIPDNLQHEDFAPTNPKNE